MEELHVTMLGARGVGKTSLLAGMYDQFETFTQGINLSLTPDRESSILLGRRLAELKRQGEEFTARPTVEGTADSQKFSFGIGTIGDKPRFQIIFRDYPGGWLHDSHKSVEIIEFVKKSQVIILAIDAPSLVEEKGRWHEEINANSQVNDVIKTALQELPPESNQKLLLLCPIKCERYMQSDSASGVENLHASLKNEYQKLLSALASEILEKKVAVAVTPVQTLGNVWFSRFGEIKESLPEYHFRRINRDAPPYAPKDVEQPLCYTISFALKQYMEKRGFIKWVGDAFSGRSSVFEKAIQQLAKKRVESKQQGFELIQGHHLLS
jgi:GTPase SAR1 family protein